MTWTSAVHVGQEMRSCQAGRQDQGTACLTTVQIGSHVLNSVDSQCSLTDFSFWKRKGHLEGTCSSPSIGFRLKNIVAVCSNWAWGDVATHMSAPGHGYIFQVVHHMTLSRNKSQCLLGACRELITGLSQVPDLDIGAIMPWMLLGAVLCVFYLAP